MLDLQALPPELRAALERVWPGCPEAQRRALLGPNCHDHFDSTWPDMLWPWKPTRRWLMPGQARMWRGIHEAHFGSRCGDILEATGPRVFEPGQPFFATPWTNAAVLVRSPVPEFFSDGEVWAMAMQLFNGEIDSGMDFARACARDMVAKKITRRSQRADWWRTRLVIMRASATGDLGSL